MISVFIFNVELCILLEILDIYTYKFGERKNIQDIKKFLTKIRSSITG